MNKKCINSFYIHYVVQRLLSLVPWVHLFQNAKMAKSQVFINVNGALINGKVCSSAKVYIYMFSTMSTTMFTKGNDFMYASLNEKALSKWYLLIKYLQIKLR